MELSAIHSTIVRGALGLVGTAFLTGLGGATRLEQLPQSWHDDEGRSVALAAHAGHRVVLTMAYANCHRICPATIAALRRLQHSLDERGETADFLIVGYDPEHDDAAAWHHYRLLHGLTRANWFFLGGTHDDTARLARELGFEFWKYDEHVMHESRVVVFDAHGVVVVAADPAKPGWANAL